MCECCLSSCLVDAFLPCKWFASASNFCACVLSLLIDLDVDC